MARTAYKGPVAGALITKYLTARVAVSAGANATLVDQIPIDRDFVVCSASLDALGVTAVASVSLTDVSGNVIMADTVVSAATPKQVIASGLTAGRRRLARGNSLQLRVTTDGGGAVPAGSLGVEVTGYYQQHATNLARWAESGQGKMAGPCSGFYDVLTIRNLRASAAQAERVEGSVKAPYACRVMSITYSVVGQTEGASAVMDVRLRNGATTNFLHAVVPMDTASGDVARVDALTGTVLGNRNVSRGDALEMHLATGANEIVPIQALTATIWVWVQGQPDLTAAVDQELDHPGAVVGPAIGGYVMLPFINKRLANASLRVEDICFLPCALRFVAGLFSRSITQTTTRRFQRSGTPVTGDFSTITYVLHNEGSSLPAPGSWTGNVPVNGVAAGEDSALREWAALNTVQFAMTGVGSAVLNDTAQALCTVKSHIYADAAND